MECCMKKTRVEKNNTKGTLQCNGIDTNFVALLFCFLLPVLLNEIIDSLYTKFTPFKTEEDRKMLEVSAHVHHDGQKYTAIYKTNKI